MEGVQYTNDVPESIKAAREDVVVVGAADRNSREEGEAPAEKMEWTVSDWVDNKTHHGPEVEHDRHLKQTGEIHVRERKGGKEGPDCLRYRAGKRE